MDLFSLDAVINLKTSGFMNGLNLAGEAFGAFADTVVGFTKDVLKTGMGFDQAMSNVQAVLGKEEGTVENMNKLRAFALDQAKDSIFTAEETANAYYYMGMAGWKSAQMQAGLPGVMALAAASGEDLAMVSDIVTDSITAFGLTADDVSGYVDILAQTATNSNTDVKRMGDTFKYVAPIAGALGADVDDVAVSIGLMANAGIKGSMAGTALRNIFTRISTNAGKTKEEIGALEIVTDKLGVQFWDNEGKMRDWSDIISECRVAWRGLTEEEQIHHAKIIASQRGMSGWLAIMNASDEEVQQLTHSIENATGAAQNMADVRMDNLQGDLDHFNSTLDVIKNNLFDDVRDPLRSVVQEGTEGLDRINNAIKEDGIIGGLKQLSTELKNIKNNETFKEFVSAAGEALGEIGSLLPELGIDFFSAAESLGASFAKGLTSGLSESIKDEHPFLAQIVGGIFGPDTSNGRGPLDTPALVEAGKVDVELVPSLKSNTIQGAIDEAKANEQTTVTIDGIEFDIETPAEQIAKELGYVGLDAGKTMAVNIGEQVSSTAPDGIGKPIRSAISGAGLDGGADMTANVYDLVSQGAPLISGVLSAFIGDAGNPAGATFSAIFSSIINGNLPGLSQEVGNVIGDAGTDAGRDIVSGIKTALSFAKFTVSVAGIISGIFNTNKNASAMSSGRIFNKPTIFGYADNAFQIAGDAGSEAVVGTNSLYSMITSAVNSATAGQEVVVPRDNGRDITIILEVDRQQFARTVYKANNEETQRVGVRLGGAY